MAEPIDIPKDPPPSKAPVVIRIILGIVFLVPGACGGLFLGATSVEWLNALSTARRTSDPYAILIIVPAITAICVSVILLGILLRYARWKNAKTASLVLAIFSALSIALAYQLAIDTTSGGDSEFEIIALLTALAALVIVSLPPLLHWWQKPRADAP